MRNFLLKKNRLRRVERRRGTNWRWVVPGSTGAHDDSDREIDTEDELEMFLQNDEENDEGVTFESDELSDELKSEIADSELSGFESAEVEDEEFIEAERVTSIIESILFATEKPQSLGVIKQAFKGTNVGSKQIKKAIEQLMVEYAGAQRGVTIEEISGGYQLQNQIG